MFVCVIVFVFVDGPARVQGDSPAAERKDLVSPFRCGESKE